MRFDEYGKKLYPATLDTTRIKPTLILCETRKLTFDTTDQAHSWAKNHGYYIEHYIEWAV